MSAIQNNEEYSEDGHLLTGSPSIRLPVFVTSVIGVLVMAIWAIVAPEQAESVIGTAVGYVVDWFGWFYVLLTTVVLVFALPCRLALR